MIPILTKDNSCLYIIIIDKNRRMSDAENYNLIMNDIMLIIMTGIKICEFIWNERVKTVNLENNIFNSKIIIICSTDL